MKKKLVRVIWILGLVFSTGFTPLYSVPDTAVNRQAPLAASNSIQVQLSVKNKAKNLAVFSIGGTDPYFSTTIYVPKGAKIIKNIKVVPGKFMVVVGFGDEQSCKSIGKTIKISKNTKRVSLSFTCGKFQ